jgi:ribosomal protein S1
MTLQPETWDLLTLLGGLGGLLGIFTGMIGWSVRSQVSSLKDSNAETTDQLRKHIDEKLESQMQRIDAHERELQDQKVAQLELRNEMLEKMHNGYVRHGDIEKLQQQISALFARIDKVIFERGTGHDS